MLTQTLIQQHEVCRCNSCNTFDTRSDTFFITLTEAILIPEISGFISGSAAILWIYSMFYYIATFNMVDIAK